MNYSPFHRSFYQLEASDLESLREVEEGWYIEYKSRLPSSSDIAKSVSAFANHYGGWLFIGVVQKGHGDNTADTAPGIPKEDVSKALARIVDSIASNVQPTPTFHVRAIEGPLPSLALPPNHAVIVVQTPMGDNSPYIHSSGRVYRRVADQSKPRAESDRGVLDDLWHRSNRAQERLADRLDHEFRLSKGEEDNILMYVHLLTDPLQSDSHRLMLDFNGFAQCMRASGANDPPIPMDNIFPCGAGFMARQVGSNDPYDLNLTWETHLDLSTTVAMPLRWVRGREAVAKLGRGHYRHAGEFSSLLKHDSLEHCRVLDLTPLPGICSAILGQYLRVLSAQGTTATIFAKVFMSNIWRSVPYFDSSEFIGHIREYGIPVVQQESALVPPGSTSGSLLLALHSDELAELGPRAATLGFRIALCGADALGIPRELLLEQSDSMVAASDRGLAALRGPSVPFVTDNDRW